MATAQAEARGYAEKVERLLDARTRAEKDPERFDEEIAQAQKLQVQAEVNYRVNKETLDRYSIVTAPREGIIMSPPSVDDVGKRWDKKQPLCKVGDPYEGEGSERQLRILVPVTPAEYNLLQADMGSRREVALQVSLRVRGMGRQTWRGLVTKLPESEAATIPLLLSNKTGGPVAVKPSTRPEQLIPQTQVYLVPIELVEPGVDIDPGVRAKVKIYCKKKTLAWWVWRSVNDLFNLGLM